MLSLIDDDEAHEESVLNVLHRLFKHHDFSLSDLKGLAQEDPFLLKSCLAERQNIVKQLKQQI